MRPWAYRLPRWLVLLIVRLCLPLFIGVYVLDAFRRGWDDMRYSLRIVRQERP